MAYKLVSDIADIRTRVLNYAQSPYAFNPFGDDWDEFAREGFLVNLRLFLEEQTLLKEASDIIKFGDGPELVAS